MWSKYIYKECWIMVKNTQVSEYLSDVEQKNICRKKLKELEVAMGNNIEEYNRYLLKYFRLLMSDVSKGRPLSASERKFVKTNKNLLQTFKETERQEYESKLISLGILPEPEKQPKTRFVVKSYDELFPETDSTKIVAQSVKKLKDAYVYLKPGIKMCEKLLDHIKTLKFTTREVVTPVETITPKPKAVAKSVAREM